MTDESMSYLDALKEIKRLKEALDKIRAEIEEHAKINQNSNIDRARALCWCLDVIDKYKTEREVRNEL
jgi:signal transduction protein with GAF and PtsI domain